MLRPLEGIEKRFAHPSNSSFIEFAIKLQDHKSVEKVVSNFNKIFIGLRLKVVNEHYAKADQEKIITNVIKLPMWIQDCKTACDWIYDNYTLPINERLTTIASNDRIVVVNSNHNVSDSGFILQSVEYCLDEDIVKALPEYAYHLSEEEKLVPIRESVAFKTEIGRAEKNKPVLHPYQHCTSFPYNIQDARFVSHCPTNIHYDDEIPVEKLTCFNQKANRPKQMSELLWTAITMSQYAMSLNLEGARRKQKLSLPIIVDTRKFVDDPSQINWRYTNCVSAANLSANPTDDTTIQGIFDLFREDLKKHIKDGIYYWINHGNFIGQPGRAYGMNSSIGVVNIKPPILDFFIQSKHQISKDMEFIQDNGCGLSVFSYSKVTPSKNTLCSTVYFDNSRSLQKETLVLRESFKHFITNIPLDMKYLDALHELQLFQKRLLKAY